MSARLPSRWLSPAALLAAGVLTSAAVAQSPDPLADPPSRHTAQTAPAPAPVQMVPTRLYVEPLLLEQEQVSEHGDRPLAAPLPEMPAPPRVYRGCGLPECDRDEGRMTPDEVTLRCLLFTINPLAAFLPLPIEVEAQTLPPPGYLEHPPQYIPPSPAFPLPREEAVRQVGAKQVRELVVMPQEVERLDVMPIEVEQLDVMPVDEESEPQYELLAPWMDYTRLFRLPKCPLTEVQVSVQEAETGSVLFGVGAEINRTGTITVTTEPLSEETPAPMPSMPKEEKAACGEPATPWEHVTWNCRDTKEEKAACVVPAAPPQVQLSLVVAEVKGKAARKLNLDAPADGKTPRWHIEVADESRRKTLEAGLIGLREKGRAKVIAEPRLLTVSGQRASFLSGGQQAVPVTTAQGQAGVQFEDFGTRVTCQPTVLTDGTIRLAVEPEISELCEVAGEAAQGVIVPGRSSQSVHTTANVPPGHTLVISGPKAGGDSRLVIFVTPTVVETPTVTGAAPGLFPQLIFDFGNAPCGCLDLFMVNDEPSEPQTRTKVLMNQSEHFGPIEYDSDPSQVVDPPSHLAPERVHAGIDEEETVHDLLVKCQRELSRGHYAAAEDLAQRAIERDRQQVAADPLVRESDLLQRVKAIASLPLGTVDPCAAKGAGGGIVPAGAAKAIGSNERIVEALLQEFNTAFKEARYHDAAALAERARDLDPENPMVAAALQVAQVQGAAMRFRDPRGAGGQSRHRE